MAIALAYVGVIVGAGLSSGQDLLQYFLSFGTEGLAGVVLLGILNIIFGNIMVTLGSYYRSGSHYEVLEKIAHPVIHKVIDAALIISSFVMGFVMVAGAGSNINQQFGIPVWAGALLCSVLIVVTAYLDFDRITHVLGVFTPVIVVMILLITGYTFIGHTYDFQALDAAARTIKPAMPSLWFSVVNYFTLCAMTGVSMAFVLGGSVVRIGVAEKGGTIGGLLVGIIVTCASLVLFAHIDTVKNADIPMLEVVNEIHPSLALVYALTISALIFNTAFSLYYAIARRFSDGDIKRMRMIMIAVTVTGYICSFGGFKQLVGIMYPILGCLGMVLLAVLLSAWYRERDNIRLEMYLRRMMIRLVLKHHDEDEVLTKKDVHLFHRLGEASAADTADIKDGVREFAGNVADKHDDLRGFADEHLPVDRDILLEHLERKEGETAGADGAGTADFSDKSAN